MLLEIESTWNCLFSFKIKILMLMSETKDQIEQEMQSFKNDNPSWMAKEADRE